MVDYKHYVPVNSGDTIVRQINSNILRWSYQLRAYLENVLFDIGVLIGINAAGIANLETRTDNLLDSIVTIRSSKLVVVTKSNGNVVYSN